MKNLLAFHVKIHSISDYFLLFLTFQARFGQFAKGIPLDSGNSKAILCVFNAIFRSLLTISSSMMSTSSINGSRMFCFS